MNLRNFENFMDKKILARGLDYYENECVSSIEERNANEYEAEVEGTDLYIVKVELDDQGNIIHTECDCPYDLCEYCKHQVAVFMVLRDMLNKSVDGKEIEAKGPDASVKINKIPVMKKVKSTDIKKILSERTKGELVEFLYNLAMEYEEIKQRIELNFDSENDAKELQRCMKLIQTYINKNADRSGFISYSDVYDAVKGAEMVLEKARHAFDQDKIMHSLDLILCVVHEMVDLLQYCDDSDGIVGGVIDESFQQVDELLETEDLGSHGKERIFEKLIEEASNPRYEGWSDWRLDWLDKCSRLVDSQKLRNKLEACLLELTEREKGSSWSTDYFKERVNLIRYHLIERCDGREKAVEFIEQNLDFSEFRAMAIEQAMKEKDYTRVIQLALEGEAHDKNRWGLVKQWKESRYKACSFSGKLNDQRSIAMDLILDGDFAYYQELKSTYDPKEWPAIYPKIIVLLENQKKTHQYVYTRILIEEGEKQKLLEHVQGSPSLVESFYKYLLPDFKEEVYAIFRRYIEEAAAKANSRKDYQRVCQIIRSLKKAGGSEHARQSKLRLMEKYPRRPAFRDELTKIKL
ncbi:hypothetical protein [Desulfitobacterium sp.]|uniref:SWIM zinc finger family protein n=1 Tax=Desulfitobacterium sp. TaxID=49981 RepID=UPI002B209027|nr:hypothetical protein [Desulfitobacterium sp.]MEA4901038.1 hypothetical protein [Desulfitobacterium sp.]